MTVESVGKPLLSDIPGKISPDVIVTEEKVDGWYLCKIRR